MNHFTLRTLQVRAIIPVMVMMLLADAAAQEPARSDPAEIEAAALEAYELGVEAHDYDRFDDALRHFRRVVELDSLVEGTLFMTSHALYAIAEIHDAEHDFIACAEYAGRSATNMHVPGYAYELQATCLMRAGLFQEALDALESGVDDDPAHMELYVLAAHMSTFLERSDAALDWLYDALEVDSEYPEVHYRLADYRRVEEDLPLVLGLSYALLLDEDDSSRGHNAREVLTFLMQPPDYDMFVEDLEYFIGEYRTRFATLGDLAVPDETRDPFWTHYVPFFIELHHAGHSEALVYFLFERSGGGYVTGGDVWLEDNRRAHEAFLEWLDEKGPRW